MSRALLPVPVTRCAAIAALAGILGGCGWWPWGGTAERDDKARVPPGAIVYQCDGNKRLVVRYDSAGKSAMVFFPEREFRLDQVVSADGARYSNTVTTLYTRGPDAFLEENAKRTFDNCKTAS